MTGRTAWGLGDIARFFRLQRPAGMTRSDDVGAKLPPLEELKLACEMLTRSKIGEASLKVIATRALACYDALTEEQRQEFFHHLLEDYAADAQALRSAYERWDAQGSQEAAAAVFQAAEPRRQHLFRRLNHAPGGTMAIIGLRRDLLAVLKQHPELRPLDADIKHLLTSWFNRGFLSMRPIKKDESPDLLRFLMEAEHVHPMKDRAELKRRIAPRDRRIYAFFHPAVKVPLIFVEVALTRGVSDQIEPLLDPGDAISPHDADTAVLYSINNSLDGLAGISFGSLLIKQVIDDVQRELPHVETFVTLSPIPGLRRWWEQHPSDSAELNELLETTDGPEALREAFEDDVDLRETFLRQVAQYLTHAVGPDGRLVDPVGRFHLGNGASVWQIDPQASLQDYAWRQSFGAMVNYRYEPAKVEERHEAFVARQDVAVSPEVQQLLDTDA